MEENQKPIIVEIERIKPKKDPNGQLRRLKTYAEMMKQEKEKEG